MIPDFRFHLLLLVHGDEGTGSIISVTCALGYFSNVGAHCKYRVPRSPSIIPLGFSSGMLDLFRTGPFSVLLTSSELVSMLVFILPSKMRSISPLIL